MVIETDLDLWYIVLHELHLVIATFVTVASSKDIRLSKLNVNAQCNINFAKTFDVADEPITEGIEFQIEAESPNADTLVRAELSSLANRAVAFNSWLFVLIDYCYSLPFVVWTILNLSGNII